MMATLIRDLASDLRDEQRMSDYIAARVRGDTNKAPPPIDRYHGIEDYEVERRAMDRSCPKGVAYADASESLAPPGNLSQDI